jgi:dolichol kinase
VYLIAVLALDAWTATALSGAVALLILALRLRFRGQLRGVSGAAGERWGEVAYPLAGAASIAVGWGLLGDRWLAFIPIAFMAWGDNVAGVVRTQVRSGRETNPWPSTAMLAVCLGMASLYQPYWVGAAGAVAATAAERFHPTAHPLWDDNWAIVAASLLAMALMSAWAVPWRT